MGVDAAVAQLAALSPARRQREDGPAAAQVFYSLAESAVAVAACSSSKTSGPAFRARLVRLYGSRLTNPGCRISPAGPPATHRGPWRAAPFKLRGAARRRGAGGPGRFEQWMGIALGREITPLCSSTKAAAWPRGPASARRPRHRRGHFRSAEALAPHLCQAPLCAAMAPGVVQTGAPSRRDALFDPRMHACRRGSGGRRQRVASSSMCRAGLDPRQPLSFAGLSRSGAPVAIGYVDQGIVGRYSRIIAGRPERRSATRTPAVGSAKQRG